MKSGPIDRADFLAPDELRAPQQARWSRQAEYVAAHSPFFQRLWQGTRPPARLEGIGELPFSDKEMLRVDQRENPPFGTYLAAKPETIMRIHRTSGTTGLAMNVCLTWADAVLTAAVGGRAFRASGLGPGHRVIHTLNYQLWMGGLTDHMNLEATGAAVVPFGVGNTERLIRTILDLKVTAISCTPSYPAVLEQALVEHFPGTKPRDLGLRLGLFGGEAGLDNLSFRARLEDTWGFKVRNANYGVTDAMCLFAGQCETTNDLHFMGGDAFHTELVVPREDRVLPFAEGETGELVLTHLEKDCQPLVRFRTGDVVTITGTDRCACGRWAPRFRVVGRADDMVVVRGINVYPVMVAALVNAEPTLSGEYRIALKGPGPYDALPIEVELATGVAESPAIAERLARAIKSGIGTTASITLLPPLSLPRTEGKTKRVVRTP
ncbi:MAG: AMP-binding protein [Alphaproteobacteria bacterium]